MIDSSRYANTIAANILSTLYRELVQLPDELDVEVKRNFDSVSTEFEILPSERHELIQLVIEICHLWTYQTTWSEYHTLATGQYAAAIDLPVVLTHRMAHVI